MKFYNYLLITVICFSVFTFSEVSAKKKTMPKVYLFGFSASFTDSLVYFTDIQAVDSAWTDTKTKFLLGRENYSYQLRDYFRDNQNKPNRTCIVMYGWKRKDAEKQLIKMKSLYTVKGKGKYNVKYLNENDFKFTPINVSYDYPETADEEKPSKKEKKRPTDMKRPNGKGPKGDTSIPDNHGGDMDGRF
jgi:hypothetical protein